jgi:membrane protease subunit HflC
MAKADAEAASIYSQAFCKDPDFYSFVKSLELYKQVLDKNSTLILSTRGELVKYLQSAKP